MYPRYYWCIVVFRQVSVFDFEGFSAPLRSRNRRRQKSPPPPDSELSPAPEHTPFPELPSSFDPKRFPEDPPELPLRGSNSGPLVDLMRWRAEIYAAKYEYNSALVARRVAVAAREAAAAVSESAATALSHAETAQDVAQRHVVTAGRRCKLAWQRYTSLCGTSIHGGGPPSGTLAGPSVGGKGEGRAQLDGECVEACTMDMS